MHFYFWNKTWTGNKQLEFFKLCIWKEHCLIFKRRKCTIHLQKNVYKLTVSLENQQNLLFSSFSFPYRMLKYTFIPMKGYGGKNWKNKSPNNITHAYNKNLLHIGLSPLKALVDSVHFFHLILNKQYSLNLW